MSKEEFLKEMEKYFDLFPEGTSFITMTKEDYDRNIGNIYEYANNNWNELKEWLSEQNVFIKEVPAFLTEIAREHRIMSNCYEATLDKMQEIESRK